MRIQTKNKYLGRLVARLFGIRGYRVQFEFSRELYDDEVMRVSFLRRALEAFDEDVAKFRKALVKAIDEAPKEE